MRKKDKLKNIEEANKRLLGENTINELTDTVNTNIDPNYMDGPTEVGIQLQLDVNTPHINIDFGEAWSYNLTKQAVQEFKSINKAKRAERLKEAGDAILKSIKDIMTSCVDGICDTK